MLRFLAQASIALQAGGHDHAELAGGAIEAPAHEFE